MKYFHSQKVDGVVISIVDEIMVFTYHSHNTVVKVVTSTDEYNRLVALYPLDSTVCFNLKKY